MEEAEEDVGAYASFPRKHQQKTWSNSSLERANKEVKRRTTVVGIFPNEAAMVRSMGSVICELHDEWQISKRYFSAGSLAKLDRRKEQTVEQPQLVASQGEVRRGATQDSYTIDKTHTSGGSEE
jgi:putative transposase